MEREREREKERERREKEKEKEKGGPIREASHLGEDHDADVL